MDEKLARSTAAGVYNDLVKRCPDICKLTPSSSLDNLKKHDKTHKLSQTRPKCETL